MWLDIIENDDGENYGENDDENYGENDDENDDENGNNNNDAKNVDIRHVLDHYHE